jgi:hypothetical protein
MTLSSARWSAGGCMAHVLGRAFDALALMHPARGPALAVASADAMH